MGLFDFFTSDIAIDLGTANTLIIHKDKIVVDEPSIIALDKITGKVLAIGREAMQMHEKTHENIKTIRPLKDGAVMASDAFFPFPDCVEIAYQAGIKSIIQPGGSIKDQESIDFCNQNHVSMVFTGIRHFKH